MLSGACKCNCIARSQAHVVFSNTFVLVLELLMPNVYTCRGTCNDFVLTLRIEYAGVVITRSGDHVKVEAARAQECFFYLLHFFQVLVHLHRFSKSWLLTPNCCPTCAYVQNLDFCKCNVQCGAGANGGPMRANGVPRVGDTGANGCQRWATNLARKRDLNPSVVNRKNPYSRSSLGNIWLFIETPLEEYPPTYLVDKYGRPGSILSRCFFYFIDNYQDKDLIMGIQDISYYLGFHLDKYSDKMV